MTRRALLALAGLALPAPAAASGTCPDRGRYLEPMPRDPLDLARTLMVAQLERYAGPVLAMVHAPLPLHPPGGALAINGRVFQFAELQAGDPACLFYVTALCHSKGTV